MVKGWQFCQNIFLLPKNGQGRPGNGVHTTGWQPHGGKKRGANAKWQKRKRAKTVNNLVICDNKQHIIAISDCISGNHHDSFEITEQMDALVASMDENKINYKDSHLNADMGFDVREFIRIAEEKHELIANIPKNKRNSKKTKQEYRYFSEYIYSFRFKIEGIFAWLDTYKRLLVRFEVLDNNFKSWLFIAATMVNLRCKFN
jgi:hypothetical protein